MSNAVNHRNFPFYVDAEKNRYIPVWFREVDSRTEAERLLVLTQTTTGKCAFMRPKANGEYVISLKTDCLSTGRPKCDHYRVFRDRNGFQLDIETEHHPKPCLSDVMRFFVSLTGTDCETLPPDDGSGYIRATPRRRGSCDQQPGYGSSAPVPPRPLQRRGSEGQHHVSMKQIGDALNQCVNRCQPKYENIPTTMTKTNPEPCRPIKKTDYINLLDYLEAQGADDVIVKSAHCATPVRAGYLNMKSLNKMAANGNNNNEIKHGGTSFHEGGVSQIQAKQGMKASCLASQLSVEVDVDKGIIHESKPASRPYYNISEYESAEQTPNVCNHDADLEDEISKLPQVPPVPLYPSTSSPPIIPRKDSLRVNLAVPARS